MRSTVVDLAVGENLLAGTLAMPSTALPGVLFLHGWGGSQQRDLALARDISALGCVCLTFDLRGHAKTESLRGTVTREQNLHDALAAYDALVARPQVDAGAVAIVGSSYGAYLAALLTTLRPVRWLSLRVPALYADDDWDTPKARLNRRRIAAYRARPVAPEDNRALAAASTFAGDVLLVESEHDRLIPHATMLSWVSAFRRAQSLTYRLVSGADHALSEPEHRAAYQRLLVAWCTEMIVGARQAGHDAATRERATPPSSQAS